MLTRIRTLLLGLYVAAGIRVRSISTKLADRMPVSVERTVASLNAVVTKLDRAVAQKRAAASFEADLQQASYDREDAANAAADHAERVRNRVKALLA